MVRFILLTCLLLGGCCTNQVKYVTQKMPEPPQVTRPELDVDNLKEGDGPDVVIQAHRVSIRKLQGYSMQLETILDGYRTKE